MGFSFHFLVPVVSEACCPSCCSAGLNGILPLLLLKDSGTDDTLTTLLLVNMMSQGSTVICMQMDHNNFNQQINFKCDVTFSPMSRLVCVTSQLMRMRGFFVSFIYFRQS